MGRAWLQPLSPGHPGLGGLSPRECRKHRLGGPGGGRPGRLAAGCCPPTHTHQGLWGAVSVPPTLRGPRGLGMLSQGARAFLKQLSSR